MRQRVSTRVGKVPALSIIYGDGRAELVQGKDVFGFVEQLVRDSRSNEPPPPPPIEETVTRLPEFDEPPSQTGVEFNMVSAMPNKYTTDGSPESYEPKSLAQNQSSEPSKDDLTFKMLDPVRSQDKIQQSLEAAPTTVSKSDDSKLDIQKILDSAKNL